MPRALMIQGAGSNVGKSMLVAGLARAFANRGLRVAPFKPQNMSNNAAVACDGGEIGRAQALQAKAARLLPHTDMNPVLLKPESDHGAQVIVQGQLYGTMRAREYGSHKSELLPRIIESFDRLSRTADLVLIEGAGSPAEVNLRRGDIANMGFAEAVDVPVVLVGDIDRGGVIAQCVGTHAVLADDDKKRIKAFIINKFRGEASLFDEGLRIIECATGWSSLGVIPWFPDAWRLPAEDVLDLARNGPHHGKIKIVVPRLGRIANFDDLDPLSAEPDVEVVLVEPGRALPGNADLILIPGSKSTISDLTAFRATGWDVDLAGHVRRGGAVLGLCGGYQMLGRRIIDTEGVEGPPSAVDGLGYLDVVTRLEPRKRLAIADATHRSTGLPVTGYEIHLGQTSGPACERAWLDLDGRPEGAASADGRVLGSYMHGMFASDAFRGWYLSGLGAEPSTRGFDDGVETTLDELAIHLERHLDLEKLHSLAARLH